MRNGISSVVATIVAGVTLACNDAAVDQITAPPLAATPAQPVLNYPYEWEYTAAGIPPGKGMNIRTTAWWENDYQTFAVRADISFEWVNYVSASLSTKVVEMLGRVVNTGSTGITYSRFLLPVARGDTSMTVKISTMGTKCGLTGRHSYSGKSAQFALHVNGNQVSLWEQIIGETSGPDISQPACPPPPPPPPPDCENEASFRLVGQTAAATYGADCEDDPSAPVGGGDPVEVCYVIWRELWYYDPVTRRNVFVARWPIGTYCYIENMS